MPRQTDRERNRQRREEINRQAWAEVDLHRRALFEERRRELLELAGLKPPRRPRRRRAGDPFRERVLRMLANDEFAAADDATLDAVEAFLDSPSARNRLALYERLNHRAPSE